MDTKTKKSLIGLIALTLVIGLLAAANSIGATSKGSTAMQTQVQTAALADSTKIKSIYTAKKTTKTVTQKTHRGPEKGMLLTLLALVVGQQGARR